MGSVASALLLAVCLSSVACDSRKAATTEDAAIVAEALPATSLQVPPGELSRLEITQPGQETVRLEVSGGEWQTLSPLPYPANTPSLESIVAVLAEIEILRPVADQPNPAHRLGDSGVLVKAWTKEGALPAFSIGASAGEETYVQRLGEEQVYAVRGRCRRIFDLSFQQLRDPTIHNIDPKEIERVTYANGFGDIDIVAHPKEPGSFVEAKPSIRNFNSERASKNVAVLAELFAKGFVDPPIEKVATGLFEQDTARVQVSLRGQSEPLTVYVGARSKDGRLHLRTSASEQIYLVSAHLSSSLMPKRKHLERSDAEIQQQQEHETAGSAEQSAPVAKHEHAKELPTQVPPDLMGELRNLAREQR